MQGSHGGVFFSCHGVASKSYYTSLALAAAYCFSTVFVFGMVAAAYGSLASTDAKQKVGLLVLFCMKLAISVGFPFR